MRKSARELVEEWDNGSYDMSLEQVLTWAERAADILRDVPESEVGDNLDPKPWVFGSMRNAVRTPGLSWTWGPRDEHEQLQSKYPKEFFA